MMASDAPLRRLCAWLLLLRQVAIEFAYDTHFVRHKLSASLRGSDPPAQRAGDARFKKALEEYRSSIFREVDTARRLALQIGRVLRDEVPFPIDEEARALEALGHLRASIAKQAKPKDGIVLGVCMRLWYLADARREPAVDTVQTTKRRGVGRKPGKERAIDLRKLAEAIVAIQEGRATSTRSISRIIGASQSAVSRSKVLKRVLEEQRHHGRPLGFRTGGGGVEAIAPTEE